MTWLLIIVAPIAFALLLATVRTVSRGNWILVIAIAAAAEVIFLDLPINWEAKHLFALWVAGVFLPWGAAASFLAFASPQLSPLRRSLVFSSSYFAALVLGLIAGDSLGVIPQ